MAEDIVEPGLVWVKDPVNRDTGEPTGALPARRHHDDCSHWYRTNDGKLLGPAPYRASEEQMLRLSPCQTCAETIPGAGGSAAAKPGDMGGHVCPRCYLETDLDGTCSNCG